MKYKLTEKYIENLGVKLFQIQAVTAFSCISKGELGGYIQSDQPPSGGCELKRTKSAIFIERIYQPPSGGCELKRV